MITLCYCIAMEETDEMDLNDGLDMCKPGVERRSLSDVFNDIVQIRENLKLTRANLSGSCACIESMGKNFYKTPKQYLPESLELVEEQLRDSLQRVKALRSKLRDRGIQ